MIRGMDEHKVMEVITEAVSFRDTFSEAFTAAFLHTAEEAERDEILYLPVIARDGLPCDILTLEHEIHQSGIAVKHDMPAADGIIAPAVVPLFPLCLFLVCAHIVPITSRSHLPDQFICFSWSSCQRKHLVFQCSVFAQTGIEAKGSFLRQTRKPVTNSLCFKEKGIGKCLLLPITGKNR